MSKKYYVHCILYVVLSGTFIQGMEVAIKAVRYAQRCDHTSRRFPIQDNIDALNERYIIEIMELNTQPTLNKDHIIQIMEPNTQPTLNKDHIIEIMEPNTKPTLNKDHIIEIMEPNTQPTLNKDHIIQIMEPNAQPTLNKDHIIQIMEPNAQPTLNEDHIIKIIEPNAQPVEIIRSIAIHCDFASRHCLQRTCKDFYSALTPEKLFPVLMNVSTKINEWNYAYWLVFAAKDDGHKTLSNRHDMLKKLLKKDSHFDIAQALSCLASNEHKSAINLYAAGKNRELIIETITSLCNSQNFKQPTSLYTANKHALILLILHNPNITDKGGSTALHWACSNKDTEIVTLLLASPRVNPNIINKYGNAALHLACNYGDTEIVELLLADPRVNPNITNNNGHTALHGACGNRRTETVILLIADPRVNPNITNNDGKTALYWACGNRHTDIVELLLANPRVKPNIINKNGHTALDCARYLGYADIVELLLANPRVKQNNKCVIT